MNINDTFTCHDIYGSSNEYEGAEVGWGCRSHLNIPTAGPRSRDLGAPDILLTSLHGRWKGSHILIQHIGYTV